MVLDRRHVVVVALLALLLPVCTTHAAYPERSVTFVVPFPPGGRTDLTARLVTQHLSKHLGQAAVVVNKPGAGGVLGAKEVAAAPPDGYTLGIFSTAVVTAQYTVPTPTDLKDYAAIAVVNVDPMALAVKSDGRWQTLKELVAYGRANPGKLRIGMIPGASAQIFAAGFANAAGLQATFVPYKGDAPGAAALAGGHIDVHVAVPVSYKALVEAKKVRMLGVAAESRSALYRDVPTFRENGVDFVIGSFHVVFAPRGTPPEVLGTLERAIERTMREPELLKQMSDSSLGHAYLNGKETADFLARQDAIYRKVIDAVGMRVAPQK
jgi:tripartite-type tricarboxylate transporter receptor subunit TctC